MLAFLAENEYLRSRQTIEVHENPEILFLGFAFATDEQKPLSTFCLHGVYSCSSMMGMPP